MSKVKQFLINLGFVLGILASIAGIATAFPPPPPATLTVPIIILQNYR